MTLPAPPLAVFHHCTALPVASILFSRLFPVSTVERLPTSRAKGAFRPRFSCWAHNTPPWVVVTGTRLSALPDHHEGTMLSTARSRWMRSRMAANSFRGTATSANWRPRTWHDELP